MAGKSTEFSRTHIVRDAPRFSGEQAHWAGYKKKLDDVSTSKKVDDARRNLRVPGRRTEVGIQELYSHVSQKYPLPKKAVQPIIQMLCNLNQ